MTITVSKSAFPEREAINLLNQRVGVKGNEVMRANTVSDVYSVLNPVMFRNRVHNGDMRIDQRNAGNAISANAAGDQWPVDRFDLYCSNANIVSMQQNQGGLTPPPGFKNYVGFTTIATGTATLVPNHLIEGYNVADLDWGLATAKICTLSFWVRSSIAGNHGGFISNQPLNRYYAYTYTINVANTWEYKTITIPGDTTGTWNKDNTRGICIFFSFRSNSNHTTLNQWYAPGSTTLGVSGCVDITQTIGATWQITGLQFEQGTVATPFEFRPYNVELAICQRYYETSFQPGNAPANGASTTAFAAGGGQNLAWAVTWGGASINMTWVPFKVPKRTTPTMSTYGNSAGQLGYLTSGTLPTTQTTTNFSANLSIAAGDANNFYLNNQLTQSVVFNLQGGWAANAEL
jgi:hypothetical protein